MLKDAISLKEYFDNQFKGLRDYMDVKFKAIDDATRLASDNVNTRLEGMNEFRNAMKDQASKFITRDELGLTLAPICIDIRTLREDGARLDGKASQKSVTIAYIISAIAMLMSGLDLLIRAFK